MLGSEIACGQTDRQTHTTTTVTLAAHARRGLMKSTKVKNPHMRGTVDGLGYEYTLTRGLPLAESLATMSR